MNAPHLPSKATLRSIVLTAAGGVLTYLLYNGVMGMTHAVTASWQAKADTAQVNDAFREQGRLIQSVLDSVHATHVETDATAQRLRDWYCAGKAGCR